MKGGRGAAEWGGSSTVMRESHISTPPAPAAARSFSSSQKTLCVCALLPPVLTIAPHCACHYHCCCCHRPQNKTDYVRLIKYGDSLYRCKELKRAALVSVLVRGGALGCSSSSSSCRLTRCVCSVAWQWWVDRQKQVLHTLVWC